MIPQRKPIIHNVKAASGLKKAAAKSLKHLLPAVYGLLFMASAALLAAACQSDSYSTGEGSLSRLRADFAEMPTGGDGWISQFTDDDGTTWHLQPLISLRWANKADSVYRVLVYHTPKGGAKEACLTEAKRVDRVLVPRIVTAQQPSNVSKRDAMELVSLSRGGRKYVNVELSVLTAPVERDNQSHILGCQVDSVKPLDGGGKHWYLSLTHDRSGIKEYYSETVYLSLDCQKSPFLMAKDDSLSLSLMTSKGWRSYDL